MGSWRVASPSGVASFDLPVEVAVVSVRVMEMPCHEVIEVVSVRNCFVAAEGTVGVVRLMAVTFVGGRAERGVRVSLFEAMVVDVRSVHVMQMTVLQEVAMPFVRDHCVHATFVVHVHVLRMIFVRHEPSLIRRELPSPASDPTRCLVHLPQEA